MPKINYFVTDANGAIHTRSSARVYTHAVVSRPNYAAQLAGASDKHWLKSDTRNFDYYTSIAEGRDPYPSKPWDRVAYAWQNRDEAWIAEHDARMAAANAERVVDAKARIEGHTVASYVEAQRQARIAKVEQNKADGYFDTFYCMGWSGRLDLAQKLAATSKGLDVTILPAQIAAKAPKKGAKA